MQLADTHVRTPYDSDRVHFDPDWRHLVARSWSDNISSPPDIPEIRKDEWVLREVAFLRKLKSDKHRVFSDKMRDFDCVLAWAGGSRTNEIRFRIEPLLLTDVDFDTISKDLSGGNIDPLVFQMYERLHYNVREDNGTLTDSCFHRTYFSFPEDQVVVRETPRTILWRVLAAHLGYTGLVYSWHWSTAHGPLLSEPFLQRDLVRLGQLQMIEQIVRGQIGNFDLVKLMGVCVDQERMLHETGKETLGVAAAHERLLDILQMAGPTMMDAASQLDNERNSRLLSGKFNVDKEVKNQIVPDHGAASGHNALFDSMKQQLAALGKNAKDIT